MSTSFERPDDGSRRSDELPTPTTEVLDEAGATRVDVPAGQPPVDPWKVEAADPWLDVTPRTDPPAPVPPARRRHAGVGVALFVAGAVAGALLTGVYTGWGSNGSATAAQAAQVQSGQNGQNGQAPQGQGAPGPGGGQAYGGQGFGGQGFGGGAGGEQHVIGTLTAVSTSKVSVRSSAGTATYTIASDTQILRDGAVAKASDLRVGDRVLLHVFPAADSDGVLERLIAVSRSGGSGGSGGTVGDTSADGGATT